VPVHSHYQDYKQSQQQAVMHLERGDWAKAAAAYRQCATLMERYSEYATSPDVRERRLAQARSLALAAEKLERVQLAPVSTVTTPGDNGYADAIAALVFKSQVCWHHIAGLDDTKREIKTIYALAVACQPAGVQLAVPRTLLFYGPPGTGKTLLAAAISNGLSATFLNVKISDILSKYFGESTKLISALYSEARERAPSVVFLDEFDALGRMRGKDREIGAERRLISTLLTELDGLNNKDDSPFVFTIAATNRPWDIDHAIRSRFTRQIYIPLPDDAARQRIIEIHLNDKGIEVGVPYEELVGLTRGYSGREIVKVCEQATMHMIGKANPDLEQVVDEGHQAVSSYQIQIEPLQAESFEAAFRVVGDPETTELDLLHFAQWRREMA
jgi:SpoVK/Ycf46/Vps4 family AAA+-type ATPase